MEAIEALAAKHANLACACCFALAGAISPFLVAFLLGTTVRNAVLLGPIPILAETLPALCALVAGFLWSPMVIGSRTDLAAGGLGAVVVMPSALVLYFLVSGIIAGASVALAVGGTLLFFMLGFTKLWIILPAGALAGWFSHRLVHGPSGVRAAE